MFDFNPLYLMYLLIGVSAAMFAEGIYLLFYNKASYRKNINRRLKVMDTKPDRGSVLVQLRRERGLTSGGEYRLPLVNFNKLVLQSGLTIGFGRLILFVVVGMIAAFTATMVFDGKSLHAVIAALFSGFVLHLMVLRFLRKRRQKKFAAQFPDAIDIIVRSLRAGHPVPIAINMVARNDRTMMSMASGNCAANFFCRRERRNLSTMKGSTKPLNSAAMTACNKRPSNTMAAANAPIIPTMTIRISPPKPMVRPDCSTSLLKLTSGNRYSPPLVSPRSRRNCTSTLSRSGLSSVTLRRRLMLWR